ncbi:MAG: thrombospondin type 3 repeat-containing protein, partial [Bacteroidota bacterium]
MKKIIFSLSFCVMLLLGHYSTAQDALTTKHGVSARVLLMDYARVNDGLDFDITSGGEIAYIRKLTNNLNFVLPLKAGIARYVGDINNTSILGADATLQFQFLPDESLVVPYVLGGGGIVFEDFSNSSIQFPAGAGINLKVGKSSYISLQGEYRFSNTDLRNNIQAGIGYVYKIGLAYADKDKDGVPDEEDGCPDAAGTAANMGCPDTDGDGIVDKADLCPDEAGVEQFSGCPDSDNDGVADRDDKCPGVVGTPRTEGCPDQDGDGFADRLDECPNEAGTIKGCPDQDEDGIIDKIDQCPQQAGAKDNNGCPKADEDGDGVEDENDECPGE